MADSRRRERERFPRRDRYSDSRRYHSPSDRSHRNRSRSPATRSIKEKSGRFEYERRSGGRGDDERGSSRFEEQRRHVRAVDEQGGRERPRDERRRRGGESSWFEEEQRHSKASDERGEREKPKDERRRKEGSSEDQMYVRGGDERGGRERSKDERRRDGRDEQQRGRMEKEPRNSTRERSKNERRRDGRGEQQRGKIEEEPRNSSTQEDKRLSRPERDRQPGRGGAKGHSKWNRNEEEDYSQYEFGMPKDSSGDEESSTQPKEKANFGLSGKLTAETNTYKDVVIKYSEPQEARQPKTRWRLYQFKGDECINTLYVHRQSAYLIGRQRHIVDFPVDHPSCSKQHAVLQYRLVEYKKEDGRKGRRVRPYIIDLDSTNGTYLNNSQIESSRYVELKERDVLKFGFSSREFVLLHENSKGDEDEQGSK